MSSDLTGVTGPVGVEARRVQQPDRSRVTLLADSELPNEIGVALRIFLLEIVEQSATLADELQQAAPRVMVFRVALEVLGQVADALAQNRDLHLRRPGCRVVGAIRPNHFRLSILRQGQVSVLHARSSRDQAAVSCFRPIRNTTVYNRTTRGCKARPLASATAARRPWASRRRTKLPGRRAIPSPSKSSTGRPCATPAASVDDRH